MRRFQIGDAQHRVAVEVYPEPASLGEAIAGQLLEAIGAAGKAGRRFVLGCPSGRTPQPVYQAMGRLAGERQVDLSMLRIAMMDDYVLAADGEYVHCPATAHYSCRRFAEEDIRSVLNRELPEAHRLAKDSIWFPDPADPDAYDNRLRQAGGIDVFITASGASDGHVAFNPPGTDAKSTSRVVPLAETTRRDNLGTFPQFRGLDDVPSYGVTVGLGSIRTLSREVILIIHGVGKRQAVERLASFGRFDPSWPATMIYDCPQGRVVLDEAAAAGLDG